MTSLIPQGPAPARPPAPAVAETAPARPSRLLAGIYHDIGMAAVAVSLNLTLDSLDGEEHESVKRGSRYIFLMPQRSAAPKAAE